MKTTKTACNKNEWDYVNTNEVIHDYEFQLQMIVEQKQMDFENLPDNSETSV